MKHCWAMHLGDCSEKITGEHLVSKSLFLNDAVEVAGFPWLNGEKKVIGLSSLTGNNLCKKHNNDLSNVDTGGKEAFDTFRKMRHAANLLEKLRPGLRPVEQYNINGPLLERWFLKTTINLTYQGNYPIGQPTVSAGVASNELVEIAFGLKAFHAGGGLYFIDQAGPLYSSDRIEFVPLIKKDESYIAGGLFSFRGFRFLIFFGPKKPPESLKGIKLGKADLSNAKLYYQLEKIEVHHGEYVAQELKLSW